MEMRYAMILCNLESPAYSDDLKILAIQDMVTDRTYTLGFDKVGYWQAFRWLWHYKTGHALPDGMPYACYSGMTREAMRELMRVLLYDDAEEDGHGQET